MTVPLDTRQDIREMDAWGVPRAEIARDLDLSRNTVRKYADQEDLSPKPPIPGERARPSTDPYADWIDSVLEADLGMVARPLLQAAIPQAVAIWVLPFPTPP